MSLIRVSSQETMVKIYLASRKFINGIIVCFGWIWVSKFEFERASSIRRLREFFISIQAIETEHKLIRIGSAHDGGYLVPGILDQIEGVVSPGLGDEFQIENFFASLGIKVLSVDASVVRPSELHKDVIFYEKFLASGSDENENNVTLEDLVNENFPFSNKLFLQCDIEGAEWQVLPDLTSDIIQKFSIIVLEVHHLNRVLQKSFSEQVIFPSFEILLKYFQVVHLHPNNAGDDFYILGQRYPELLELTFMRSDLIQNMVGPLKLPTPLDKPNIPQFKSRAYPKLKIE